MNLLKVSMSNSTYFGFLLYVKIAYINRYCNISMLVYLIILLRYLEAFYIKTQPKSISTCIQSTPNFSISAYILYPT